MATIGKGENFVVIQKLASESNIQRDGPAWVA